MSFKLGMGEKDHALWNYIASHKHSVPDVAAAGIKLRRAEQSLHNAESECEFRRFTPYEVAVILPMGRPSPRHCIGHKDRSNRQAVG